jgi:hypothetical protein
LTTSFIQHSEKFKDYQAKDQDLEVNPRPKIHLLNRHRHHHHHHHQPPSSPLPLSRLPWKTFLLAGKSTDFVLLLEPPSSLQELS